MTTQALPENEKRTDLVAALVVVWRHKLLVLISCAICGIGAAVLALTMTPIYRAEVSVTAVRPANAAGSASAIASQLSGLAGLNLGQASAEVQTAEAVLQSRRLVEEFIKRNSLESQLSRNQKSKPTLWMAVKLFQEKVLTIHKDAHRGVTVIAIEWTDPVTAARWANGFVELANDILRMRALNESSRNIAYVRDQLGKTDAVEIRHVMYDIIETEMKTLMLANGRMEYAFQVVDPAVPPELRARPKRTLIVAIGVLLGLIIGVVVALLRERISRTRVMVRATGDAALAARGG